MEKIQMIQLIQYYWRRQIKQYPRQMQQMQQHQSWKREMLQDHLRLRLPWKKQSMKIQSPKVVVAGSVEMFADSADQIVSGNNSAMFTDIIAQMVGDSDLATSVIPTKDYTLSAITVDAAAGILYGLGLMIVLPVIMMILGIVIWASRRKK